ncbi:MAG: SHOCT domain-containing protein [Bacilli bacterium]
MYTKGFTHEMVVNEAKYYVSKRIITKMLARGELTENEFEELDKLNAISFNAIVKDLL